jgi:hypothetical protein
VNYGYAVVTINQASQHAEEVGSVFWSLSDAHDAAEEMREATKRVGRGERFRICQLVEVESE